MNKDWILFHLQEAKEELERLMRELDNPEFEEIDLMIDFQHLYNHINTAWNSRNEPIESVADHSSEQFYVWRQFPSDIDMGL